MTAICSFFQLGNSMMVCLGGASKEIDRLIKDCVVDDEDDLP